MTPSSFNTVDRMIEPLSGILNEESARRLVALKPEPALQARVDYLAEKCSEGTLTPDEREDYSRCVSFGTFIALLNSKARLLLK